MSNFYCIWVRTGFEKQFIEKVQAVFDSFPEEENGKLHCVGKQIRLKSGKEYIDPLFPGYVFWETDNISTIQDIKDEEGIECRKIICIVQCVISLFSWTFACPGRFNSFR